MEYCLKCEKDSVSFGAVKIKVGKMGYDTKAKRCLECGYFEKTPKLQKEIDQWGLNIPDSIMEFQPYFSTDLIKTVDDLCMRFNMKRTEFIKVCTAFYLAILTEEPNFKGMRKMALEKADLSFQGPKAKINVQVKYNLFKKIDLFTRVWKLDYTSNVIEEAVKFCALTIDDKLSQSSKQLVREIEIIALTA